MLEKSQDHIPRVGTNTINFIMAYPKVHIANSTNFTAKGTVEYDSAFCGNDDYTAKPHKTWKANSRGICLLTKITATLSTPNGNIQAKAYTSSGTSYSQFAIVQTGDHKFAVTRLVGAFASDDMEVPAGYVEPTEQQK